MWLPQSPTQAVPRWMEIMVIAKPSEFCSASALPTISGAQARADRAENCGESATAAAPHNNSSPALAQPAQPLLSG